MFYLLFFKNKQQKKSILKNYLYKINLIANNIFKCIYSLNFDMHYIIIEIILIYFDFHNQDIVLYIL